MRKVSDSREIQSEIPYRLLMDAIPLKMFFKDLKSKYIWGNAAYAKDIKIEAAKIAGKTDFDFYPPELAERYIADDRQVMQRGQIFEAEEGYVQDGQEIFVRKIKVPVKDASGKTIGLLALSRDITEKKIAQIHTEESEAKYRALNQTLNEEIEERKRAEFIISRQAREILEVSIPVIQIWEGIVSVPLIGTLDSQRTQQLMERLLQRIVDTNSSIALIDVTGVPAIDTQTAQHLIETMKAVQLLGAQVILTGIRPAIAQTLVHLGINLANVNTRSSLASGLQFAIDQLGMQVKSKDK